LAWNLHSKKSINLGLLILQTIDLESVVKKSYKTLVPGLIFGLASVSAQATIVSFDDGDPNYIAGTPGAYGQVFQTSPYEAGGDALKFGDFKVFGSLSRINLTNTYDFEYSNPDEIKNGGVAAYQDSGANAGLGVYTKDGYIGSDDSFQSNVGSGPAHDEVLIFKFDVDTMLQQIWFNGDHQETVATGSKKSDNAIFNIFFSEDGEYFSSIYEYDDPYSWARAPEDGEYLNTMDGEYLASEISDWDFTGAKYWAVAATGWGDHASYIEGIQYSTAVPEPATLALFGLGILGLGTRSRSKKKSVD
jgi:hypothetical protein